MFFALTHNSDSQSLLEATQKEADRLASEVLRLTEQDREIEFSLKSTGNDISNRINDFYEEFSTCQRANEQGINENRRRGAINTERIEKQKEMQDEQKRGFNTMTNNLDKMNARLEKAKDNLSTRIDDGRT